MLFRKINDSAIIKFGFLGGIAQFGFCLLMASILTMIERMMPEPPSPLAAILVFLLLFVSSAAISGLCVLGYPLYLAFQKRFIEGLMTLIITIGTLVIASILALLVVSAVSA